MLLALLSSAAHAGTLAFTLGMAAGGGEDAGASWQSVAPMTSGSYMTHILFLEGWAGASSSMLLARRHDQSVLAAPLQAEAGLGIGGRAFGVGLFTSAGLSGPGGGLYGHLTFPGPGWIERMGLDARLAGYPSTGTSAVELLWRIEPGHGRRKDEKVPPPPPYAPEDAPTEPVYHDEPEPV